MALKERIVLARRKREVKNCGYMWYREVSKLSKFKYVVMVTMF